MQTRALTKSEQDTLAKHGCSADNWNAIQVHPNFTPEHIANTRFSGEISLGESLAILNATLHNASVAANCRIENTTLDNVSVADNTLIRDVKEIRHAPPFLLDAAPPVNILAEDGARNVPLWRNLSSQWAHLILHFKNTPVARKLESLVAADIAADHFPRSRIGPNCRLRFSGVLRNVRLGPGTVIEGAAALSDCRTVSTPDSPVCIGEGVAASACVFLRACRVSGGVRLEHSLVGEGVVLDHAAFATHSLFFANSEFSLGESACSLVGPFTVSHHKATLVLTCQSSFANFGSGANASNHHFKLGPRHGGVLRRGVRCGSGSYILWPADIGAFTSVIGRHPRHLDTAAFPFSLLTASGERSVLVPGVNLFTAGLFRDERKWPARDRREGVRAPRDLVTCAILSPYTMEAVEAGMRLLRDNRETALKNGEFEHGGAVVPASRVDPALRLYEQCLVFFLGDRLFSRAPTAAAAAEALTRHAPGERQGDSPWRDWGGMLLSGGDAGAFLAWLEGDESVDAEAVDVRLAGLHAGYAGAEMRWVASRWLRRYGEPTPESVGRFAEFWLEAVRFRCERMLADAAKEFSPGVMVGFGVEDRNGRAAAFRRVRGEAGEDPVCRLIREDCDRLLAVGRAVVDGLDA